MPNASEPRAGWRRHSTPITSHGAKTEVATDDAADHGDGASTAPMLTENEAPDGGGVDLRHRDQLVAEMGKQKLADDPTAP